MICSPNIELEQDSWSCGETVCGIDEVGRGPIAGPVVAAAVVFDPSHQPNSKIRDSKKMTPKMRSEMYEFILAEASDFGIGLVSAMEIDEIGIVSATKKAMRMAIEMLSSVPGRLLIDAVALEDIKIPQKSIIKGDMTCYSIAAASILAKVYRDRIVAGLDNVYRGYGFAGHKGYGSASHYAAIKINGLTPEHRRTFLKKVRTFNSKF